MARKRKDKTDMPPATPRQPAAKDARKGSRHKPRKMMALPPWLYEALRADARKNQRPAAWHLRHVIIQALLASGTITQADVDGHHDDRQ
jgi:hypothetical protein